MKRKARLQNAINWVARSGKAPVPGLGLNAYLIGHIIAEVCRLDDGQPLLEPTSEVKDKPEDQAWQDTGTEQFKDTLQRAWNEGPAVTDHKPLFTRLSEIATDFNLVYADREAVREAINHIKEVEVTSQALCNARDGWIKRYEEMQKERIEWERKYIACKDELSGQVDDSEEWERRCKALQKDMDGTCRVLDDTRKQVAELDADLAEARQVIARIDSIINN